MLKLKVFVALLAVVALLLVPTAAFAQPLVCGFYGSATSEGADVADGTSVTAWIDGDQVAETTTTNSAYSLRIEGDYSGSTVVFLVGPSTAEESSLWDAGDNKNVDLTVGEAPAAATTPAGPAGPPGPPGPPGPAGAKGAKGDTGSAGAKGDTGSAGAKGDTGSAGAKGSTGAKGDTGSAGAKGAKGERGPAGPAGSAGSTGSAGSAGAKGDRGPEGSAGAKGSAGAAGSDAAGGVALPIVAIVLAVIAIVLAFVWRSKQQETP